ncbi:MAG: hypothetical protein ABSG15_11400, partial [FCB group bacterium]
MIQKFILRMIVVSILLYPSLSWSQIYLGLGPEYVLPVGSFANVNKSTIGVNLQLESRQICKYWYGLRLDYMSFTKSNNIVIGENYYKNAFYLSPTFRYNFVCSDCYKYTTIPYLQGMLTMSS